MVLILFQKVHCINIIAPGINTICFHALNLFIGPSIPERSSYPSKPIKSPTKPPPPISFPPAKPIVPPVSETASSLDDLLSDLNQAATGSSFPGPPPANAGTSQRCSAEGPGLVGSLRTNEKTWFQISGPDLVPSDITVNAIGPSGPNKTDLSQSGDRVRVEYTPKVAGEYYIDIMVNSLLLLLLLLFTLFYRLEDNISLVPRSITASTLRSSQISAQLMEWA